MKALERAHRRTLPTGLTMVRLDGRAFHSYTRGLQRPFDATFAADMDATAAAVATEASGCVAAYVQSDEISLLFDDRGRLEGQAWFGGVTAKVTSISAALASVVLNELRPGQGRALFDSRVFALPVPADVASYFVWRQRDCVKNSVSMAARARYSHSSMRGVNTDQLRERLAADGCPWEELDAGFRFGRLLTREVFQEPVTYRDGRTGQDCTTLATRSRWVSAPAPRFSSDPAGYPLRLLRGTAASS